MATSSLNGVTCTAKPVLNSHEQTLYNLCEAYFYLDQKKSNRYPVLSQVRLVDAITVDSSSSFIDGIQFNSMSFDILITDSKANPLCIFEADGYEHNNVRNRIECDRLKDAIAQKAGIPLFRVKVDGVHPPIDIVHIEATVGNFEYGRKYPLPGGGLQSYNRTEHPDAQRLLEIADIELLLIKANWPFPAGWEFITDYQPRT